MRMVDCWTWLLMPSLVHFLDFSKVYNLVAGMSMMNMVVCLYRRYRTLHRPVPWCSPRNTSERERELESRPHRTLPYAETDWLSSVHVDTYILHAPYLCIYKYWMCWYIVVMIYYDILCNIYIYYTQVLWLLPCHMSTLLVGPLCLGQGT